MKLRPALFLDRDGVVNVDVGFLRRISDVALLPGAAVLISEMNRLAVPVIVISNQSGLARGLLTERDLLAVQRELSRQLESSRARIDAWYHCPYHPDFPDQYLNAIGDRKPAPGMLLRAASEHAVHLGQSILVGDKLSDLEAGARAGCRNILVRTGHGCDTEHVLSSQPALTRGLLATFDSLFDARQLLRKELAG